MSSCDEALARLKESLRAEQCRIRRTRKADANRASKAEALKDANPHLPDAPVDVDSQQHRKPPPAPPPRMPSSPQQHRKSPLPLPRQPPSPLAERRRPVSPVTPPLWHSRGREGVGVGQETVAVAAGWAATLLQSVRRSMDRISLSAGGMESVHDTATIRMELSEIERNCQALVRAVEGAEATVAQAEASRAKESDSNRDRVTRVDANCHARLKGLEEKLAASEHRALLAEGKLQLDAFDSAGAEAERSRERDIDGIKAREADRAVLLQELQADKNEVAELRREAGKRDTALLAQQVEDAVSLETTRMRVEHRAYAHAREAEMEQSHQAEMAEAKRRMDTQLEAACQRAGEAEAEVGRAGDRLEAFKTETAHARQRETDARQAESVALRTQLAQVLDDSVQQSRTTAPGCSSRLEDELQHQQQQRQPSSPLSGGSGSGGPSSSPHEDRESQQQRRSCRPLPWGRVGGLEEHRQPDAATKRQLSSETVARSHGSLDQLLQSQGGGNSSPNTTLAGRRAGVSLH